MDSPVSGAAARVRNAQDLLVYMDTWRPGLRAQVLANAPDDVRVGIVDAGRTAWVPIEIDARFVKAIIDTLGREDAQLLWRDYTGRFAETPLQRSLIEGAKRLFGFDVAGIVKVVPSIWSNSFRDAGKVWIGRPIENSIDLEIEDLPAPMVAHDGYFILLEGLFRGLYRLVGREENVEFHGDAGAARVRATFHW